MGAIETRLEPDIGEGDISDFTRREIERVSGFKPPMRAKVIPLFPEATPYTPTTTNPPLPMVACLYKLGAAYDLRRSVGTQEQANECKGQCDYASKSCYTPFEMPRPPNPPYLYDTGF